MFTGMLFKYSQMRKLRCVLILYLRAEIFGSSFGVKMNNLKGGGGVGNRKNSTSVGIMY